MDAPLVYLPMDRRHALARGEALPDRTEGAALFVDVSGFTQVTDALVADLGPQRGAEELTRLLNLVYDPLIGEIHAHGGSVIAFAGDALTCWFDGDSGLGAVACALAIQAVMRETAAVETPDGSRVRLTVKAAAAAGPARRFLVGDPQSRLIEALAGDTLVRLAAAAGWAKRGEVVIDPYTLARLGDSLAAAPRGDEAGLVCCGVVEALTIAVNRRPWPPLPGPVDDEVIRPWLLLPVYERLLYGLGSFLAELRPTIALFVRFSGIDFDDDDEAGTKLDAYIRWVLHVASRFEGTLIDLNIGDKGAYLYVNFGAPLAHEDDAVRAAAAALELRSIPQPLSFIKPPQIGLARGRMRAGAYGGSEHRTYGVLGPEVNLAARLMMAAGAGQILVSSTLAAEIGGSFTFASLPPMAIKGRPAPVSVFALEAAAVRRSAHLMANAALPLVGRGREMEAAVRCLERAKEGQGGVLAIVGSAGIGKSRLTAEIIHSAEQMGFASFSGECLSYDINASYHVWRTIWRDLLEVDASADADAVAQALADRLAAVSPELALRVPLLGAVLHLTLPETTLTAALDPKLRKGSLEALLVDWLRATAPAQPLLLTLDDCQWLDLLSLDLLEVVERAAADLPLLLLLTYRPGTDERLERVKHGVTAHGSELVLRPLDDEDARQLMLLKLAQLFGTPEIMAPMLGKRILAQADGNPFHIEEMVNYLYSQGVRPSDAAALNRLDLPASLQNLVLSRIDRVSERQQSGIKVASIVGRSIHPAWLSGVSSALGDAAQVAADLNALCHHDLMMPDALDEARFQFKQAIIQGVVYESLPFAMRTDLHEAMGLFLERTYLDAHVHFLDLLVFHFDRSQNDAKRAEYLRRAGEAAQAAYANEAAIDYYRRALPLLEPAERVDVQLRLGEVYGIVGGWDEALGWCEDARRLAISLADSHRIGWASLAVGELLRKQGHYAEAGEMLAAATAVFESAADAAGLGQVLHLAGTLATQQGDYATAKSRYLASLAIRREAGDRRSEASLLSNLGIVARYEGDYAAARALHKEALAIRRELDDRWAIAVSLNNLGNVALDMGDAETAWSLVAQSVTLWRQVGDLASTAAALNNLGNAARSQGDSLLADRLYRESLELYRNLGARWLIANLFEDMAALAAQDERPRRALTLFGAAARLRRELGTPLSTAEAQKLEERLAPAREALGANEAQTASDAGVAMTLDEAVAYAEAAVH